MTNYPYLHNTFRTNKLFNEMNKQERMEFHQSQNINRTNYLVEKKVKEHIDDYIEDAIIHPDNKLQNNLDNFEKQQQEAREAKLMKKFSKKNNKINKLFKER